MLGDVHTNAIEGVWSLFKRSLMGSFHKVSMKHIDRYLSELEWRYNNRRNERIFVDTLRRIVRTEALPYADLVADRGGVSALHQLDNHRRKSRGRGTEAFVRHVVTFGGPRHYTRRISLTPIGHTTIERNSARSRMTGQ